MPKSLNEIRARVTAWRQGRSDVRVDHLIDDLAEAVDSHVLDMQMLEASLSNRGQASLRARQAMRDLVTAAAAIGDAENGDEIAKVERINAALGRLEDLAVEALVAAGRAGDTDFEAGAAFDLFWPEGLPPPLMPLREPAPGEHVEARMQRAGLTPAAEDDDTGGSD